MNTKPRILLGSACLALSLTAGIAVGPVTPLLAPAQASGTNNQYQHALVKGDRGTDVVALQYMLRSRGFAVSVDGSFGPGTLRAVKQFQASRNLTADGIVGTRTWTAAHVTTSATSGGVNDRKALQYLIKHKYRPSLVVDGKYGPATTDAVRDFQAHNGNTRRNYVSDGDWTKMLGHFERPNSSHCTYFTGGHNWGTASAVGQLEKAAQGWNRSAYGKPSVGHLSSEHGGRLNPHTSHRVGLDVDYAVFNTSESQCSETLTWRNSRYNRTATRAFIKRLWAGGRVKKVLFNDPVLRQEGLSVYASGHDNHFHVRFREHGFQQGYDYR